MRWSGKDSDKTLPVKNAAQFSYQKPDGILTFDILENLTRTGVKHEHDQPSHLRVKPQQQAMANGDSFKIFGGPESKLCPAKVYEYPDNRDKLQISAQNCIHCKCCSIKTPNEFIRWTVPEGGGGPQYSGM